MCDHGTQNQSSFESEIYHLKAERISFPLDNIYDIYEYLQ